MAQIITVQGVRFPGVTGVKVEPQSPRDKALASLPGLKYFMDPTRLNATGQGRDAVSGVLFSPTGIEVTVVSGKKVVRQAEVSDKIAMAVPGLATSGGSFSLIVKASATSDAVSSTSNLFSLSAPTSIADLRFNLRSTSASLRFYANAGTGGDDVRTAPGSLVADTPFICCVSYDAATNIQTIYMDDPTAPKDQDVQAVPPVVTDDHWFIFGGINYGAGGGWRGDQWGSMVFDVPLHLPQYGWVREKAFAVI